MASYSPGCFPSQVGGVGIVARSRVPGTLTFQPVSEVRKQSNIREMQGSLQNKVTQSPLLSGFVSHTDTCRHTTLPGPGQGTSLPGLLVFPFINLRWR